MSMTIDDFLRADGEEHEAGGAAYRGMTLSELEARGSARLEWIWQGLLARGATTLLTSQWKTGKTTLLSVLLARMAGGGSLGGLDVAAGKAAVVTEEGPSHWQGRGRKLGLGDHITFYCRPFLRPPNPDEWLELIATLARLHTDRGLDLVVIDPLAAFLPGGAENDASNALRAMGPLAKLTDLGLAVLVLHHPAKGRRLEGQSARGSGALSAAADVLIEMSHVGRTNDAPECRIGFQPVQKQHSAESGDGECSPVSPKPEMRISEKSAYTAEPGDGEGSSRSRQTSGAEDQTNGPHAPSEKKVNFLPPSWGRVRVGGTDIDMSASSEPAGRPSDPNSSESGSGECSPVSPKPGMRISEKSAYTDESGGEGACRIGFQPVQNQPVRVANASYKTVSGKAPDSSRQRRLRLWSRFEETPGELVIELTAAGDDYVRIDAADADDLGLQWMLIESVMDARRSALTRKAIREHWPEDYPPPAPTVLWRWLEAGVEAGRFRRAGSGRKNDPFRYYVPGRTGAWRRWWTRLMPEETDEFIAEIVGIDPPPAD